MRGESGIFRKGLFSLWYVLHPDLAQRDGGDSMGSIKCVQGQGGGSRGQIILIPISEGIPQDILQSFGVQESQEDVQPLHLALSGPLYPKFSTCFEGARLTQLVQLVTAGRLFLGHKGRVDL